MATEIHQLAKFVTDARFEMISNEAKDELKKRLLDSMGVAIRALSGEPVKYISQLFDAFGGNSLATFIGGGKSSPERVAFYNSALVRYLDFNDSYLAKGETGHPSDNIGSVMAATEYVNGNGKDFLTALAVAYQVQCRLSDVAPVRAKGFDHTVQGSYAAAAGVSKALNLDMKKAANAMAIAGTAYNALRVTRTGYLSHWKGLAYPSVGFTSTHAAFLAKYGITGPEEVFEGNKGFKHSIAGDFEIDWTSENLEIVTKTIIKKFNAEIHSQSTLEGMIELKTEHNIHPSKVEKIEIETFDVAYHIIGGGEEGSKINIRKKEEADHSLQYMTAAALIDGRVMPEQYNQLRIENADVQDLLKKISVKENKRYSNAFPNHIYSHITVFMHDGQVLKKEKSDYEGFVTRPASWEIIEKKFSDLSKKVINDHQKEQIIEVVKNLEGYNITDLTELLGAIKH